MSSECTICGVVTEHIEIHHKIPQRFDGPNEFWNLEGLCRSCHVAVEKMYNKEFWEYLDMGPTSSKSTCDNISCGATEVKRFKVKSPKVGLMKPRFRSYCYDHAICSYNFCGNEAKPIDRIVWDIADNGHKFAAVSSDLLCSDHRICEHPGCKSTTVIRIERPGKWVFGQSLCYSHMDEVKDIDIHNLVRIAKRDDAARSGATA